MIYIIGWLLTYYSLVIQNFTKYKGKFFFLLVILALGFISVFRGNIGTDTLSYEQIFSTFRGDNSFQGWEPIFTFLIKLIQYFVTSDAIVLRIFDSLYLLLIITFLSKSNKNETFFLMAYYIPSFYYQHSMNMIRLGLASSLLMIMVQIMRKRIRKATVPATAAIGFHYSILFNISYIMFHSLNIKILKRLFAIISLCLVIGICYNYNYFEYKLNLYSNYQPPSPVSGLGKFIAILIVLFGVIYCDIPKVDRLRILLSGFFLLLIALGIAHFSYAGLRLLELLQLAIPLAILYLYNKNQIIFDPRIKSALFISGIVSVFTTYRGFINTYGLGEAPFLPYEFFW